MTRRAILAAVVAGLVGACATSVDPILMGEESLAPTPAPLGQLQLRGILLLDPSLRYIDLQTEEQLATFTDRTAPIKRALLELAARETAKRGFRSVRHPAMARDRIVALDELVASGAIDSLGAAIDRDTVVTNVAVLRQLQELSGAEGALVHVSTIKVGKEQGRKHLVLGRIEPLVSSSEIRAYLVHLSSGQVLWKSGVFLREVADANNLEKPVEVLFSTFPERMEGTR